MEIIIELNGSANEQEEQLKNVEIFFSENMSVCNEGCNYVKKPTYYQNRRPVLNINKIHGHWKQ